MFGEVRVQKFPIPATPFEIGYELGDGGELLGITLAGIRYVQREGEDLVFAGDWVRFRESTLGRAFYRKVTASAGQWLETYLFNSSGLATMVDGTLIERNALGYVIRCSDQNEQWRYRYENHHLVVVEGPSGRCKMAFASTQRPLSFEAKTHASFSYDDAGRRCDIPQPKAGWHRDSLGRLWTITNGNGRVTTTYLWWGFACLARIDGPPGDPLAAVFSLDATATPVRVITPTSMTRMTRDAFGENLTKDPTIPGLFGGAQDGRFFHYRSRVMDPRIGSFTAPDPWDGSAKDPRRKSGSRAALPVEMPPAGRYCVCQNDPLSRMDPTGEISAGVGSFLTTLSSLTWAFQNNITGVNLLGFWNMLLSFLSFNGKVIGRLGDVETIRSSYTGGWGVRANPAGLELLGINRGRAWVVQHILWSRDEEFDVRSRARVFVPKDAFEPKLYGSLLWLRPKQGRKPKDAGIDFVLSGQQINGAPAQQVPAIAPNWSRSGGTGKPVFPGSSTPWFPEGGLHFSYQHSVHAPVDGTIAEIQPDGEIYKGTLISRRIIIADGLKKTPGKGTILMSNRGHQVGLHTVRGHFSEMGISHLVLEDKDPPLAHFLADLFQVTLASKNEILNAGTNVRQLDAAKLITRFHYEKDQLVRLEGGVPSVIAGAKIKALEAKLTLDANPPATRGSSPFKVFRVGSLISKGEVKINGKREVEFGKKEVKPKSDDYLVLKAGDFSGIYKLSAGANTEKFTTDRDMDPVLVLAAKGPWFLATRLSHIGTWNGILNGKELTYQPLRSGLAPEKGPILFQNGEKEILGARNVVKRVMDEILFDQDLPGGIMDHKVTKMTKGERLASDVYVRERSALTLDESPARRQALKKSPVLHMLPLGVPNITSGTSDAVSKGELLIQKQKWDGAKIEITAFTISEFPKTLAGTYAPIPGQVVVLRENGTQNIELAVVKKLTMTVTFDRTPSFPAGFLAPAKDWAMVPLEEQGLYFKGERKNHREIVMQPKAYTMSATNTFDTSAPGIRTEAVWLPRFRKGEFVRVVWRKGAVQGSNIYRIDAILGTALALGGGPNLPADQDHFAICQLEARWPNSGTYRSAFEGVFIAPTKYSFSVWRPTGLRKVAYALVSKKMAAPVQISAINQLDITFYKTPAMPAGKDIDIIIPNIAKPPAFTAYHRVVEDEWFFPSLPFLPGHERVLIQSFKAPKDGAHRAGSFSTGTNRIPADSSDKVELDSRESLETHELQHTIQALTQGPVFLTMIPHFLFDTIALATGEGLETAKFSAFVDGVLATTNGVRRLRIPNPNGIGFEKGRKVQLVQNGNAVKVSLTDSGTDGFRISGAGGLADGQVAVRLERKSATEKLAKASAWLELFSVGGIQTALLGPLVNLIPWSIAQIVHACNKDPGGRFTQPEMFPATVPDGQNPFQILVAPKDGESHGFAVHDNLEVEVGGNRDVHTVVAVNANLVSLDTATRFSGSNRNLNVGKIGEKHPMKAVVDTLADTFGTRDLRWFFDPLGQLFYEVDPNDRKTLDWTLATLRPFYSTTSWSGLGLLGGFWLDIVYTTLFGQDYYSFMEQSASELSGRMYSPIGRLRGDLAFVGDLGRYFYYHDVGLGRRKKITVNRLNSFEVQILLTTLQLGEPAFTELDFRIGQEIEVWWGTGSNRSQQMFEIKHVNKNFIGTLEIKLKLQTVPGLDAIGGIPSGHTDYFIFSAYHRRFDNAALMKTKQGDSPGLHLRDFLRALPFRNPPGDPPGREPNLAARSPSISSQALPHQLFIKSAKAPLGPPAGDPDGFVPSIQGSIPTTPALERTGGMYVAFCQPSNNPHRLTLANGFTSDMGKGRIAQRVCGTRRQTLFFDRQVKDVTLQHQNKTLTGEMHLVLCQRAKLRVDPNKNRVYEITVADPKFDQIARNVETMTLLAQTKTGNTLVEVARRYDGQSPPTHLHLPFVVPVRQLNVKVGDTLQLREDAKPEAAELNRDAKPGDTFYLLVPAKPSKPNLKAVETRNYVAPPPAGHLDPDSGMVPLAKKDLTSATAGFIGPGKVYRVQFKADDPPEESLTYHWEIPVEAGQKYAPKKITAILKCSVKLQPHFRLVPKITAGKFELAKAMNSKLVLKPDAATIALEGTPLITSKSIEKAHEKLDVQITDGGKSVTIATLADTPIGIYQILVAKKNEASVKARRTFQVK